MSTTTNWWPMGRPPPPQGYTIPAKYTISHDDLRIIWNALDCSLLYVLDPEEMPKAALKERLEEAMERVPLQFSLKR